MGKKAGGLLYSELTRREFIKKGLLGLAGLGLGAYVLKELFSKQEKGIFRQINDSFKSYSANPNPSLAHTFKGDAPKTLWKWSKESYYYNKLDNNNVQCTLCPNSCILEPDDRSICRTRVNKDGKLYTIAYGNPCSANVDPVEKKPLFHFLPGTEVFSIATAGCNFRCLQCQNWQISQSKPEETRNFDLMPEEAVSAALSQGSPSIAYTYSGPIAFYEYMLDTAKIARKAGIKNINVTQGYENEAPLRELCRYMDAMHIDLKYFSDELYVKTSAAHLQPVLDYMKILKEEKVWFEIINLVIPTINDDVDMIKDMCSWIYQNLGPDHPLHFSRFHPEYKLTNLPPTPVKTLEEARKIALNSGLKYVYIGNVPGTEAENTYCPKDGKLLIERKGYQITQNNIVDGACKFCGEKIAGVWEV